MTISTYFDCMLSELYEFFMGAEIVKIQKLSTKAASPARRLWVLRARPRLPPSVTQSHKSKEVSSADPDDAGSPCGVS